MSTPSTTPSPSLFGRSTCKTPPTQPPQCSSLPKFASTNPKIFSASAKGSGLPNLVGEPAFFPIARAFRNSAHAGNAPPTVVFAGIGGVDGADGAPAAIIASDGRESAHES